MDELIDILNEDLTFQKTCLKSYAHMHGLLHGTVHIWFYTDGQKILLQKRSKNKIAFPNLWDVSVAGHINSNEDIYEAAVREVNEEIGLKILKNQLINIGFHKEKFKHNKNFIDNELHYIFICKLNRAINKLIIQEEEVSEIKLVPILELKSKINDNNLDNYVPHSKEYYSKVLSKIENCTKKIR